MKRRISRISGIVFALLGLCCVIAAVLSFIAINTDKDTANEHRRNSHATIERAIAARDAGDAQSAQRLFDEAGSDAAQMERYQRAADTDLLLAEGCSGAALIGFAVGGVFILTSRRRPDPPADLASATAEAVESINRAVNSITGEYRIAQSAVVTEHILRIGPGVRAQFDATPASDNGADRG